MFVCTQSTCTLHVADRQIETVQYTCTCGIHESCVVTDRLHWQLHVHVQ